MEYSRKRSRSSNSTTATATAATTTTTTTTTGHDSLSAKEREVADILTGFDRYHKTSMGWYSVILEWGIRRKRSSAISNYNASDFPTTKCRRSPTTPLSLSLSSTDSDTAADPPRPPARRTPSASKSERARKAPNRRGPKKKTHKELKDMVNTLSAEKSRLEQEKEHMSKTWKDLKDWNEHLRSQLALHFEIRKEEKLHSPSQPTSSDPDSPQETDTSFVFDLSPGNDERKLSENFAGSLPLVSAYDDAQNVERSKEFHSPKSPPSASGKGCSSTPNGDPFCSSGCPDANNPIESLSDIAPNGYDDQLLLPVSKAVVAANARKRRIELTRSKYAQSQKARLR